ncbi:hypothetical protein [Candidatus Synechococcus spongiarum]|uniref:Type I restriction-modification system,restriction subunit R n=1 Tax=Candidatus Synechococcus spongiarum TaxID=431041 RepID=A0A171DHS6_9SYNE|nr:hypothetical protein [Candidatus Synechococcus spongiarum]SAY39381.1 Type I restriction-modification system,restriction subunit R (EC 3.1.21.3) [Candidatus Synechococcus spongiarum]
MLSGTILEAIDVDSYRAEKKTMQAILLYGADGEIDPVPSEGSGGQREAELDLLSNIIANFNDLFGKIEWKDKDQAGKMITEDIDDFNCGNLLQQRKHFKRSKNSSSSQSGNNNVPIRRCGCLSMVFKSL